jgi:hypothetical protein
MEKKKENTSLILGESMLQLPDYVGDFVMTLSVFFSI